MEETFWNWYARVYDELSFIIPYQELHTEIATRSLFGLPKHARALDAGCGTGHLLCLLAGVHPSWELTGIDRSGSMLRVAERKLSRKEVTLLQHDMRDRLPFPDASFDAVTSTNVLYTLPAPEKHLHELRRVLEPGGLLVLVNPWSPKPLDVLRAHFRSIAEGHRLGKALQTVWYMPTYMTILLLNAVIAAKAKSRAYHFLPMDELRGMLARCGFTVSSFHDDAYGNTCCFVRARAA